MNVLQRKPEVVVFAGPNGSGKSTFTELLKPPLDYINADEKRCEVLGKCCFTAFLNDADFDRFHAILQKIIFYRLVYMQQISGEGEIQMAMRYS